MHWILKIFGSLWAVLGAAIIANSDWSPGPVKPDTAGTLILGVLMFIFPGLVLYGIGARITPKPVAPSKTCPFCAESVKREAIVCPHCRRDLPPIAAATFPT